VLSEESWVREVSSGDNRDEEKAYGKGEDRKVVVIVIKLHYMHV
jgi:hypothetical protein